MRRREFISGLENAAALLIAGWAAAPTLPLVGWLGVRIFAVIGVTTVATSVVLGAEITTITSCPSPPMIPVKFVVDCSRVKNAAMRQLCKPFIANQACKVFPAYRTCLWSGTTTLA